MLHGVWPAAWCVGQAQACSRPSCRNIAATPHVAAGASAAADELADGGWLAAVPDGSKSAGADVVAHQACQSSTSTTRPWPWPTEEWQRLPPPSEDMPRSRAGFPARVSPHAANLRASHFKVASRSFAFCKPTCPRFKITTHCFTHVVNLRVSHIAWRRTFSTLCEPTFFTL